MGGNRRFFSEVNHRGNHAGTKARNDVEAILRSMGIRSVNSKVYELTTNEDESLIISNVKTRLNLIRYYLDLVVVRGDAVFIQYPMLSFDFDSDYYKRLKKRNQLIFLIHDIHSLRIAGQEKGTGQLYNRDSLRKEIEKLNLADVVIVHTEQMKKLLTEAGLQVSHIMILDVFDYLYKGPLPLEGAEPEHIERLKGKREISVAFAGNLRKSAFLRKAVSANPDVEFVLYGAGCMDALREYTNVNYAGNFLPDEIPGIIRGRFGLVWDGRDIHTCSGILGEYTRINCPHKLSLYIVAGLPVIVWKDAAVADYVRANGIGICLESLEELYSQLHDISDRTYGQMKNAVLKIRKELCTGDHLKDILGKAYDICLDEGSSDHRF